MPVRATKHVLKPGTSSVFVGGGMRQATVSWRLDVREDAQGNRHLFGKRKRASVPGRGRGKLFHYISAGGMRQLRRTSTDDVIEERRRAFLTFLGVLATVWVLLYFLPCF